MSYRLTPEQARAAWCAALRSGKYGQCRRQLTELMQADRIYANHCCLGVACEVMLEQEGPDALVVHDNMLSETRSYDDAAYTLPERAMNWLGMENLEGSIDATGLNLPEEALDAVDEYQSSPTHMSSLALLNDVGKYSFDQIADVIEQRLAYA